eukprot:comp22213_c1_seq1/m.32701 comp22213_c1_seq1/g.32701  ORF comp22213_c1_seq1/g.32701 comp22213_c1_seq1/m.32701 type:complete len:409 (-) comp22213_c1_seq1:392-1618(-)
MAGTTTKLKKGLRSPRSTSPGRQLSFTVGVDLYQSLKPVDRVILSYLVITTPLLFITPSWRSVVWDGFLIRLLLVPTTLALRHFLATHLPGADDQCKHRTSFGSRQVTLNPSRLAAFWLDVYPLITCVYLYSEDGKVIQNLYGGLWFIDEFLHQIDFNWFGVDPKIGIGAQLRSMTGAGFNVWFGEYMHFCYFAFYFILGGTWPLIWLLCPREQFDRTTTVVTLTYLSCLACYLIMPAKGPFWTYGPPAPGEVGVFFSYITHAIDESGSSRGTAMPSAHCGLTMANWLCAMLYLWPLAAIYMLVAPGLIFSTMWCGFHYGVDSLFGCLVGGLCCVVGVWMAKNTTYHFPQCDDKYRDGFARLPVYVVPAPGAMAQNWPNADVDMVDSDDSLSPTRTYSDIEMNSPPRR